MFSLGSENSRDFDFSASPIRICGYYFFCDDFDVGKRPKVFEDDVEQCGRGVPDGCPINLLRISSKSFSIFGLIVAVAIR